MPAMPQWALYAFGAFIGISVVSIVSIKLVVSPPLVAVIPPAQTVDWFIANQDSLKFISGKCENDPGGFGKSAECNNAEAAAVQVSQKTMWQDAPPPSLAAPNPFPNANADSNAGAKAP